MLPFIRYLVKLTFNAFVVENEDSTESKLRTRNPPVVLPAGGGHMARCASVAQALCTSLHCSGWAPFPGSPPCSLASLPGLPPASLHWSLSVKHSRAHRGSHRLPAPPVLHDSGPALMLLPQDGPQSLPVCGTRGQRLDGASSGTPTLELVTPAASQSCRKFAAGGLGPQSRPSVKGLVCKNATSRPQQSLVAKPLGPARTPS